MHLTVAVSAEHHALLELRDDLLPRAGYPTVRNSKLLVACIPVVEVEQLRRVHLVTCMAAAAEPCDRPQFHTPPAFRRGMHVDEIRVFARVSTAVAVRAEEVALRDFGEQAF